MGHRRRNSCLQRSIRLDCKEALVLFSLENVLITDILQVALFASWFTCKSPYPFALARQR